MKSQISKLQSELDELYAAQRDYSAHYASSKYNMRLEEIKNKGYKVYRNNVGNHILEKANNHTNSTHSNLNDKKVYNEKKQSSIDFSSILGFIFNKKLFVLIIIIVGIILIKNKQFSLPTFSSEIVGNWEYKDGPDYFIYQFNKDGSLVYYSHNTFSDDYTETYKYELDSKKGTLKFKDEKGGEYNFEYSINDDMLSLKNDGNVLLLKKTN